MSRPKTLRAPQPVRTESRHCLLVVAATLLAVGLLACGQEAGVSNESPDQSSQTDTSDTETDTGSDPLSGDVGDDVFENTDTSAGDAGDASDDAIILDLGPPVIEPRICDQGVCFWLLDPTEYPEAGDERVSAIHCNERGIAHGCPLGTVCGPIRQLASGTVTPVCEPIADDLRIVDLDLPSYFNQPAQTPGVPVEMSVMFGGEALPERSTWNPAENLITITHQSSETQWSIPIPVDTSEPISLNLLEGMHDVFIRLNGAAYPGSNIPTTTLRGLIEVVSGGDLALDLPNTPINVRLRFRGSTLTGPESGLMRLTFENAARQLVTYQFSAGNRGIASIPLTPGDYTVQLQVNGLPSLFPTTAWRLPYQIRVPGTESLELDLVPELVRGSLSVNGDVPSDTAQVGLGVSQGVQWLTLSTTDPGTFSALVWPEVSYDILFRDFVVPSFGILDEGWSADGSELELAVETDSVAFVVDVSGVSRMDQSMADAMAVELRSDGYFNTLQTQIRGGIWDPETTSVRFEGEMVMGEAVVASIRTWGNGPGGAWPLGPYALEPVNRGETAWSYITMNVSAQDEDGEVHALNYVQLRFYHPDWTGWSANIYEASWNDINGGQIFHGDSLRTTFYGRLESNTQNWFGGELGTIAVDSDATYDVVLGIRDIEGTLTMDSEALPNDATWRRGSVYFWEQGSGGTFMNIAVGAPANYGLFVVQGVFQISAGCEGQSCIDAGLSSRPILYDRVLLGQDQPDLVPR